MNDVTFLGPTPSLGSWRAGMPPRMRRACSPIRSPIGRVGRTAPLSSIAALPSSGIRACQHNSQRFPSIHGSRENYRGWRALYKCSWSPVLPAAERRLHLSGWLRNLQFPWGKLVPPTFLYESCNIFKRRLCPLRGRPLRSTPTGLPALDDRRGWNDSVITRDRARWKTLFRCCWNPLRHHECRFQCMDIYYVRVL